MLKDNTQDVSRVILMSTTTQKELQQVAGSQK
jgi:hypothetical protein